MNPAEVIANKLDAAGIADKGTSLFIGRIPAERMEENGLWCVIAQGGTQFGGNFAQWKTRHTLQVMLLTTIDEAQSMYDKDHLVRETLLEIPTVNESIPYLTVTPVQDNDLAEAEMRVGVWTVELITLNYGSPE